MSKIDLGVRWDVEQLQLLSKEVEGSDVEQCALYLEGCSELEKEASESFRPEVILVQQAASSETLFDFDVNSDLALAWAEFGSEPLVRKTLELASGFGVRVSYLPRVSSLVGPGGQHESEIGYFSGLGFDPSLSETSAVCRLLEVARYTKAAIHLSNLSSARSVELVKDAKAAGVDVTCDVTSAHLLYCEDDLEAASSELKLVPPLRGREDKEALINGVKEGVIDVICSGHTFLTTSSKLADFYSASAGRKGLQSFTKDLNALKEHIPAKRLQEAAESRPKDILFKK